MILRTLRSHGLEGLAAGGQGHGIWGPGGDVPAQIDFSQLSWMGCQNAGWGFFAAACRQVAACKRCFAYLVSKVHLQFIQLYICSQAVQHGFLSVVQYFGKLCGVL